MAEGVDLGPVARDAYRQEYLRGVGVLPESGRREAWRAAAEAVKQAVLAEQKTPGEEYLRQYRDLSTQLVRTEAERDRLAEAAEGRYCVVALYADAAGRWQVDHIPYSTDALALQRLGHLVDVGMATAGHVQAISLCRMDEEP